MASATPLELSGMATTTSVGGGARPRSIFEMPSELLVCIFSHVVADAEPDEKNFAVNRLRTVSGHWKTIVDTSPSLWSVVNTAFPPLYNAKALTLSRDQSLTVLYGSLPRERDELGLQEWMRVAETFLAMVLMHAARWREAEFTRIQASHWSLRNMNYAFLTSLVAPRLERLVMSCDGERDGMHKIEILAGHTPSLRHLRIHVPIRWQSNIFTNLQSLHIEHTGSHGPSTQEILHLLARSPSLESVELNYLSPISTPADTPVTSQLQLRSLRRLRLNLPTDVTLYLLHRISAPGIREFRYAARSQAYEQDPLLPTENAHTQQFFRTLFRFFPNNPCNALYITIQNHRLSWRVRTGHPDGSYEFDLSGFDHHVVLDWMVGALRLGFLTPPRATFITSGESRYLTDRALETLSRVPLVYTITIENWSDELQQPFPRRMRVQPTYSVLEGGNTDWLFRTLRHLELRGCHIDGPCLLDMLHQRMDLPEDVRPVALETLTVVDADLDDETVNAITALVGSQVFRYTPWAK